MYSDRVKPNGPLGRPPIDTARSLELGVPSSLARVYGLKWAVRDVAVPHD